MTEAGQSIHNRAKADCDGCANHGRQAVFAIVKGHGDDTEEDDHREGGEKDDPSAADWNPKCAAERWLGPSKANESAEFEKEGEGIQKHIGDNEFSERNQNKDRIKQR